MTIVSGVAIVIQNFANELVKNGFEICIIAQYIKNNIWQFDNRIQLIEVGGPLTKSPLHWMLLNSSIKKRYLKALKSKYSDILFPHFYPTHFFCTELEKKYFGCIIYYCHEPFRFFYDLEFTRRASLFQRIFMPLISIFFKKYDIIGGKNVNKVICNSHFIKQKIKLIYDRDAEVIFPFPKKSLKFNNSLDIRLNSNLKSNNPIIFTLGLSSHSKGVSELMKIFSKLIKRNTEIKLFIGGKISDENLTIIDNEVKKLSIMRESIIRIGYLNEEDLNTYYMQSTITYYTAIDESFGLIPVESMNMGTPVIAFEGGPSETILNGKTGFVIKNSDLDDFVEKSLLLITDITLREQFSKNAKKHAEENFIFGKSVEKLLNVFDEVLQTKK